ncbi:MAG: zinc-ribbon domain-containing protein [Acidobacteriia bacterium]|nr:zinc-ribbon domain-containing protein [Terriglobia bacterium]
MKVEIRCPACGRGYLIDPAKIPRAGAKVGCKACGAAIEVPGPVGPPAQTAPARQTPSSPAPVSTAREASAPAASGLAATPSMSGGEVVCPRCGLHFAPAKGAPAETGSTRPTVLVVEDLDYFLEIAKEALSPKYAVRTARSLREARAALSSGRIDAILLDLTLEGGEDGLTLLREMPVKRCPVLIFTAEDEAEMYGEPWDRLRALGADDLVIKGIHVGESLARRVGALLGEPAPEEPDRR